MSVKRAQAEQILTNSLLTELLESYKYMQFEEWSSEPDYDKREALYAKTHAVNDVMGYVKNKCQGIVDGHY